MGIGFIKLRRGKLSDISQLKEGSIFYELFLTLEQKAVFLVGHGVFLDVRGALVGVYTCGDLAD